MTAVACKSAAQLLERVFCWKKRAARRADGRMDGWQDGSGLKRAWQCSPSVARDKVSRMEAAGPNCKHAAESLYWSFPSAEGGNLAKSAAAGPGSLNFKVGTEYRHYYCLCLEVLSCSTCQCH